MMFRFLVVLALLMFSSPAAWAERVAVVVGAQMAPYQAVAEAFETACAAAPTPTGPKAIVRYTFERFALGDVKRESTAREVLTKQPPDILFAVGDSALRFGLELEVAPIVHALAPSALRSREARVPVVGVAFPPGPVRGLLRMLSVVPEVRRVGVLHSDATAHWVSRARAALDGRGITLEAVEVVSSEAVPEALLGLLPRIDAFWMVPDRTVVTPRTVDFLLEKSLDRGVPVLAFAAKYLSRGAAVAVALDLEAVGRQACGLVQGLLSGATSVPESSAPPDLFEVKINPNALRTARRNRRSRFPETFP